MCLYKYLVLSNLAPIPPHYKILGGNAAKTYGGKKILCIAVFLWSLSTVVTPLFAGSVTSLFILRFFLGLGEGFYSQHTRTHVHTHIWIHIHNHTITRIYIYIHVKISIYLASIISTNSSSPSPSLSYPYPSTPPPILLLTNLLPPGLGMPAIYHIFAHRVPVEKRSRAFGYLVAMGTLGQTVAALVCTLVHKALQNVF